MSNYTSSKHNFSIFISMIIADNKFLIVSDPKTPQFVIYQVNSTDYTFYSIGISPTSSNILGFQIFNNFDLLVLLNNKIIIYSLLNILNPQMIASYSLTSPNQRVKIVISSVTQYCYFPFGNEALAFYPKKKNSLYADAHLVPNSLKIQFQIDFLPLNLDPNTQIKLLQINTATNDVSKLVIVNLDKQSVQFYPNTIVDILNLLQPLTVTYSTNINTQELTANEIETLIYSSYIDNSLFIKEFSSSVSLFDPTISSSRMNYILSKHYFSQVFYFPVENFISSVLAPINNFKLLASTQFRNNIFIVDDLIDISLSPNTFLNIYELTLTYSAQNLPPWLNFDLTSLSFFGVPTIDYLDQNFTITIMVSNGFQNASDSFELKIRYYQPYANMSLQQQIGTNPWAGAEITVFFNKYSFIDPNNGTLSYSAKLTNNDPLPSWAVFDDSHFSFKLSPPDSAIFKTYNVNLTASNKHFSCSDQFSFYVYPSVEYILKLISEILSGLLVVIGYFKYKSLVYNILFKKYYYYPPQEILFNQFYEQEIYFIKEDLNRGWRVWQILIKDECFKKYNENILLQIDFKKNFSNDLKQANKKKNQQNLSEKTDKIEDILLDVDNTIFTVCECFLYHHLMQTHKKLNKKYHQLFKNKNHSKDWYQNYVTFSNEPRNKKVQKFKKVTIFMDKIKSKFESMPTMDEINENASFHLIYGMIKADALGIPCQPRKWYQKLEYSRGGSCFLDVSDISQISITKSADGGNFKVLEINNTRNLPSWFDYKIKNGILIWNGKPDLFEEAIYNVNLIDRSGFKIRSQDIEVVELRKRKNIELENNIKNIIDSEEVIILVAEEDYKKNEIK